MSNSLDLSRSGPTLCWPWSGLKLFAKVISSRQKWPLAGNIADVAEDNRKMQFFFLFHTINIVHLAHLKHLIETLRMSTHTLCFLDEI